MLSGLSLPAGLAATTSPAVPLLTGDIAIGLTMVVGGVLAFVIWDELDMSERVSRIPFIKEGGVFGMGLIFGPEVISVVMGSFSGLVTLGTIDVLGFVSVSTEGAAVAGVVFVVSALFLRNVDWDLFES